MSCNRRKRLYSSQPEKGNRVGDTNNHVCDKKLTANKGTRLVEFIAMTR